MRLRNPAAEQQPSDGGPHQSAEPIRQSRSTTILDMTMLYVSKSGAVLVGMLILPQFSHLLGAEQFGVVAVIFSFQALLLILDLGMSTLVSRDLAASDAVGESSLVWRTGELVVSALYAVLIPTVVLLSHFINTGLSPVQLVAALLLFWVLTIQNIGQAALLARHHFVAAGGIQVIGVVARGIATLLALRLIAADLTVFLAAQLSFAIAQTIVTRMRCAQLLGPQVASAVTLRPTLADCVRMANRGRSLVLFGIAGAAVMQLDKPIVTAFTSAAQIAPYYLATALCLTPLSVLAGPVAQYFQPRLVRATTSNNSTAARKVLKPYITSIVLVTMIPSALLWTFREPIVLAWLGNPSLAPDVATYTAILLPGVALGAIGFVPYGILVARQDYRFQAVASTALTVVTLVATIGFARVQSVQGVCWVYAAYHAASTLMSWVRCVQDQPRGARYASAAALQTAAIVGITALFAATIIAVGRRVL